VIHDRRYKLVILVGVAILISVAFLFVSPIRQDPQYHNFADQRTVLGVPNFWNVISNLPFAVCGLLGLFFLASREATQSFEFGSERWAYVLFFAALVLTCVGSSYYHLHPDNDTLVWDRLPMSIGFMAILAAVIAERVDISLGTRSLGPLLVLGISSVLFWHWTELRGAGDLRFYAVVQFFPMLAIPAMVLFFSSRYTGGKYLLILAGFYAAAKVLEFFDAPIFSVGHLLSGHTLKHLSSAAGTFWVLVMLQKRKLTQSMNLDSVGIPHAKTRGIGMTAPQKTP
jgi:hypothetical protein